MPENPTPENLLKAAALMLPNTAFGSKNIKNAVNTYILKWFPMGEQNPFMELIIVKKTKEVRVLWSASPTFVYTEDDGTFSPTEAAEFVGYLGLFLKAALLIERKLEE